MRKYFITVSLIISAAISFAQQQFGGIGAQLFLDTMGGHTMPCVQGMLPNSSADKYLKATDFIIKVNGISCLDKNMQEVVGMIRGEVGTTVKITVADTKEGKNPREYDMVRGAITSAPAPGSAPVDPAIAFNAQCETEVARMKKGGSQIIKTFPSECGNYFFNFNAEAHAYHIKVMALQDKETDAANPFSLSVRVFDNANEASATQLPEYGVKDAGASGRIDINGEITFKKECVATINVIPHNDVKKCRAMYIVVYK